MSADFFPSKLTFLKNSSGIQSQYETVLIQIRPDLTSVTPYLGTNCLQRLSAGKELI